MVKFHTPISILSDSSVFSTNIILIGISGSRDGALLWKAKKGQPICMLTYFQVIVSDDYFEFEWVMKYVAYKEGNYIVGYAKNSTN